MCEFKFSYIKKFPFRSNPKDIFVLQFYCFLFVIQVVRNLEKFGSLADFKAVLVVQVHLSHVHCAHGSF